MIAQTTRLVRLAGFAAAGDVLALPLCRDFLAPVACESDTDVMKQPPIGRAIVAPEVFDTSDLVKVKMLGAVRSGAMLTPIWILTAAHCIPGVPTSEIVITGTWPGSPSITAIAAADFTADGLDVAVIHPPRALPRSSTDALPVITTYDNDRLRDAKVETLSDGVSQLAVRSGGVDRPSLNDGPFRSEVLKVNDATDKTIQPQIDAGSIASGDGGGRSYLSVWVDPNRHDRGICRVIAGVVSLCDVRCLSGPENTSGWMWICEVDDCVIATRVLIQDKIAAVFADTSGERNDASALFRDTTPAGVNQSRACRNVARPSAGATLPVRAPSGPGVQHVRSMCTDSVQALAQPTCGFKLKNSVQMGRSTTGLRRVRETHFERTRPSFKIISQSILSISAGRSACFTLVPHYLARSKNGIRVETCHINGGNRNEISNCKRCVYAAWRRRPRR